MLHVPNMVNFSGRNNQLIGLTITESDIADSNDAKLKDLRKRLI